MLVHLSVRDFAIIDTLDLALEPGLVALTGETGAGKSILLDALELLRGGRARTDLIRAGTDKAVVSAQLELPSSWEGTISRLLEEAGLPSCDDGALVLRRVLARSGRHKQFINGALATVAQMKDLVSRVLVITGQSEEQELRAAAEQRTVLDHFGGHGDLVEKVGSCVHQWRALRDERQELQQAADGKLARIDWLRFQIDEIDALDPRLGEVDELKEERERLKNVEGVRIAAAGALEALEGEGDALGAIQRAAHTLTKARDRRLEEIGGQLEEAATLLDDAARSLHRSAEDLAEDPERLVVVDDRLDAIGRVVRKHGGSLERALLARDEMHRELDNIEHSEERLDALERELDAAALEVGRACDSLSRKRRANARKLAKSIEDELKDLGMKRASVRVDVEPIPPRENEVVLGDGETRRAALSHGADRITVWLQANPGEEGGPIGRAASGGELSRVHLAIKRALLERDPVPISVFDEVDAGVGGAVAEAIGEKLAAIAVGGRQVLCVTHLPQIASRAAVHLLVEKQVEGGRTRTVVTRLDKRAREQEIARMLGGKKITARTRAHAAEMLQAAR